MEATNTVGVLIMPLKQAPASFKPAGKGSVYRGGGGGKGARSEPEPAAKPFQLPVGSDDEIQNGSRVQPTMKQMAVTPGKETRTEPLPGAKHRLMIQPGERPFFGLYHFHNDQMTDKDIVNVGNQCARKRGVYTNSFSGAYKDLKDSDPALMAAMGVTVDPEGQSKHEALLGVMSRPKRFRPSDNTDPDATDDEAEEDTPPSPKRPRSEDGDALGQEGQPECGEENPEDAMLSDARAGVDINDTPEVPQESVSRPDLAVGLMFQVTVEGERVWPSSCHPLPGGGLEISYTGVKPECYVHTNVFSNCVKPMELSATLHTVMDWIGKGADSGPQGERQVSAETALLKKDEDPDEIKLSGLGDCKELVTVHNTEDDGKAVDSWWFTDTKTNELVAKVSIWTLLE